MAVRNAIGSAAAWWCERLAGLRAKSAVETTTCVANPPGATAITASPTCHRVTPGPTRLIVPETSLPSATGPGGRPG